MTVKPAFAAGEIKPSPVAIDNLHLRSVNGDLTTALDELVGALDAGAFGEPIVIRSRATARLVMALDRARATLGRAKTGAAA